MIDIIRYITLGVSIICLVIIFLIDYRNKKVNIFNFKYLFFIYLIISIPLSNVIVNNISNIYTDSRFNYNFTPEIQYLTSFLTMIFFVFLTIGLVIGNFIKLKTPNILKKNMNISRIYTIINILIFVGYLSFFVLLYINGGITTFLANRSYWRSFGLVGQGILIFPSTTVLAYTPILYLITLKYKKKMITLDYIKLLIFTIISLIPSFILGFRSLIVIPLIQIFIAYNYLIKRIKVKTLIGYGIIIIIGFIYYGIYREFGLLSVSELIELYNVRPDLILNVFLRIRGSDIFSVILRETNSINQLKLGYEIFVESLTVYIPGSIWQYKPIPLSVQFSQIFFNVGGGVSPTLMGELYWHFGVVGITFYSFVFGATISMIYNLLSKNLRKDSSLLVYLIFYTTIVLFAEAITGNLNSLVLNLIAIIPILFFLTNGSKIKYEN